MSANTKHDQPFGLLGSRLIALGIPHALPVLSPSLLNLRLSPVTNEDRLATPFDDDVLALGNAGELDLHLGHGQNVGGRRHALEELRDGGLRDGGGEDTQRTNHEVGEGTVIVLVLGFVGLEVRDLGRVLDDGGGVQQALLEDTAGFR